MQISPDCLIWGLHHPDIGIDFDIVMRTTLTGVRHENTGKH